MSEDVKAKSKTTSQTHSDGRPESSARSSHSHQKWTWIGLVIVFLICVVANYVAAKMTLRGDLTEGNIFTLSQGTKEILRGIDPGAKVKLRYYVTQDGDLMGPGEASFARRVEDLLVEFKRVAEGNLIFEKLDPEPATEAEDSARLEGIQQQRSSETGAPIYHGLSVEYLDKKEVIPYLSEAKESLLEYDVARAISRVYSPDRKKVGLMTSMMISGGGMPAMMGGQPQEPWVAFMDLRQDYDLQMLPVAGDPIPPDIDVLIVLHPYDLTPEGEFAIDQYVLNGGNVIMAVDPMFFAARTMQPQQNPMMPQMGGGMGPEPSSDAPTLFSAWGVGYNPARVVADLEYIANSQDPSYPATVLTIPSAGMSNESPITGELNNLFMITAGAFTGKPAEGLESTVLVHASDNSKLVGSFEGDPSQDLSSLRKGFTPDETEQAIALRLAGTFKTAFPEGKPKGPEESEEGEADPDGADEKAEGDEKAEDKKETEEAFLKEGVKPGTVTLFADVDFLHNQFAVSRDPRMPGMAFISNGNLSLFQNAIDVAAGDSRLVSIRSRGAVRRPFTLLNEKWNEAQQRYADEMEKLRAAEEEATQGLAEALGEQLGKGESEVVISGELKTKIEDLRKQEYETSKALRELEKEVKRDFDRITSTIKLGNTLTMPLLIVLAGIVIAIVRKTVTAAR